MRFTLLRQSVLGCTSAAGRAIKAKPVRYVAKFFLVKWVHVYGRHVVAARSSEYATALGVSDKTVTKVMRELVTAGLMSRSVIKSGKRGRPSNGYQISEAALCLIKDAEAVDLAHVADRIETILSEKSSGNLFGLRLLEMTLLAHSNKSGQVSLSKRDVMRLTGMSWQSVINNLICLQRSGRVTSIKLPYSEDSYIAHSDLVVHIRISELAPFGYIRFLLPAEWFKDVQGKDIVSYLASGVSGVVRSSLGEDLRFDLRRELMADQRSKLRACQGASLAAYVQHIVEYYALWVLQERHRLIDVPGGTFLLCTELESRIRDELLAEWTANYPDWQDAFVYMLHDVILNFAFNLKSYFGGLIFSGKKKYPENIFRSSFSVYAALDRNYHGGWADYAFSLYICHKSFSNSSGDTYEIQPGALLDANSLKSSRE